MRARRRALRAATTLIRTTATAAVDCSTLARAWGIAAGVEDRLVGAETDRPNARARLEQFTELLALAAEVAGEREAGEARSLGHADLGIGRHQRLFRLLHIGAAFQQGRR